MWISFFVSTKRYSFIDKRLHLKIRPLQEKAGICVSPDDISGDMETKKFSYVKYFQRENHYLQKMVEEVDDYAILLLDEEGKVLNWHRGIEKLLGYSSDEIIGCHFSVLYSTEEREKHFPESLIRKAVRDGKAFHGGCRVRKDGTVFQGSTVITALHDEHGKVIGFTKIIHVADRPDQVREAPERYDKKPDLPRVQYDKMVEEVEDYAIFMLDREGTIMTWNEGAERIKGYKTDEIIGRNFRVFYPSEDQKKRIPEKLIEKAAREGKVSAEGWRVRKDGTVFWGRVVITALHDEKGEVIGFTKIAHDLTDHKLTDDVRQLEQKNKELEQIIYITSHDLQEPLGTISSIADLLEQNWKEDLDKDARLCLSYISEATSRLADMIKALLDYSLIGRERKLEQVDCNKIVAEIIHEIRPAIDRTHATIEVETLPTFNANSIEIKLLLQNLIYNAIKYHRKNVPPHISITAQQKDGMFKFTVKDNGIGIEEKYYERVFTIFQRLYPRTEYQGTGIGLAHCKKIVGLYGGKIWVHSILNKGSTFHFTIPFQAV